MENCKMLTELEKKSFTENVLIPNFTHLIEQNIYSVLFDYNLEIVVCTNLSAQSLDLTNWREAKGLSFRNYADTTIANKIFGDLYTEQTSKVLHKYARKIYAIQQTVFSSKNVISFIDLLPYGGKFISYLVTYVPILHPSGEVIAIQSFATQSRFFSYQEYLQLIVNNTNNSKHSNLLAPLTSRQYEIMFLLANGISPEQCAQILKISRSTVGNIIATQLCPKFGIPGSNTKLLMQLAIKHEYQKLIPPTLYRPYIVILDEKLALQIEKIL